MITSEIQETESPILTELTPRTLVTGCYEGNLDKRVVVLVTDEETVMILRDEDPENPESVGSIYPLVSKFVECIQWTLFRGTISLTQ